MAISLYSGTPGSYKSYHAVCDVLDWLRRGRNVIANFAIDTGKYFKIKNIGKFFFVPTADLTVRFLVDFAQEHHQPGYKAQTLVVIDEASILFNSRQFDRRDRMDWINFLANHRHLNYDFILIAQQDRMIDRQIRGLIETEYKHRALKSIKTFGLILSLIFGGLFVCVEYYYPTRMRLDSNIIRFRKRRANAYDTMALFDFSKKGGKAIEKKDSVHQSEPIVEPEPDCPASS